jgi:selenocysteine-specific elongation factor
VTVVVGTAGHVDHGKTALLRALTGIDADRLPQERERGLTLDVGYAYGSPDGGDEIDFVDVPGHDRLVGNMLVGVGEIDATLLVVAADDGPRAQTWEHLGLLHAMAVERAVVAITKCDLVDEARLADVSAAVSTALLGTRLAGAPTVAVSSTTGVGLEALRAELAALRDRVDAAPPRPHRGAWLAADRAFSRRGHGLVVTGSSRGAPIAVGDELAVRPGTARVRVRSVQVHGGAQPAGPARGRVALNLAGVQAAALRRGQLLTGSSVDGLSSDDPLAPFESDRLLVLLEAPAALPGRPDRDPWPPRDGTEARLHLGTEQVAARLHRGGRLAVTTPDDRALARLSLDHPVATAVGERLVLRRPPPAGLLAGGLVLGTSLPARRRPPLDAATLGRLTAAAEAGDAPALADCRLELHGTDGSRLAAEVEAEVGTVLLAAVDEQHRTQPATRGLPLPAARAAISGVIRARTDASAEQSAGLADTVVAALVGRGELQRDGEVLRRPGHTLPAKDPAIAAARERLVASLDVAAPPSLRVAADHAGCPAQAWRDLEREGRIVVVGDDLAWSRGAWERLRDEALALAREAPLTPARLRDATGSSRKYVVALLEDLDRRGILERTAAGHVPGPRTQEAR